MEINKVEKASKFLDRIKQLDMEIISIDKMAIFVASNKAEINLSLKVTDLQKRKEMPKIEPEEQAQSLYKSFLFSWQPKTDEATFIIDYEINESIEDTVTLEILAVILHRKTKERELLINKIKNL